MDGMNHVIDPREEVKKLQNLVRQLELQNAQLRSKNKLRESPPRILARKRNSLTDTNDNHPSHSLDDVEVIDVEGIDLNDEDSWLFSSPKKLTAEQKSVNPYKWMRRDVEDPQNTELQTVKRALVNKLDEITRARFTGLSRLQSPSWSQPDVEPLMPHLKPSLGFGRAIDSRTFTRPKKKRDEHEYRMPEFGKETRSIPEVPARSSLDVETPEDDCLSTASDSSFSVSSLHRLADVVDVQTMARMQEESLRESSPISSPRRSSASSSQPSVTSPLANTDAGVANNIDHVISDPGGRHHFCQSNPESLDESLHSSPSESPYGSQCLVEDPNKSGSFCHSLPNLNKPQNGTHPHHSTHAKHTTPLRQHLSESKLQHPSVRQSSGSHTTDTDSDRESRGSRESTPGKDSRLQPPQSRRESLQATNSTAMVRTGSPGPKTGIPQLRRSGSPSDSTPRSGLPKPVQRRIPAPRARSSIPSAGGGRNFSTRPQSSDDSWKDGCF